MVNLKDIYTPNPICFSPNTTVAEVIKVMGEKDIGCVVIVDEAKKLAGIFSERDFLKNGDPSIFTKEVSEFMTKSVTTATLSDSLEDAETLMREGNFRHLPIVENEEVIGMVSSKDLFAACHNAEVIRRKQTEAVNAMIITYSHEIRNPLTIILGKIKRAQPKVVTDTVEEAGIRIKKVLDNINRIERLGFVNYDKEQKMVKLPEDPEDSNS